MIELLYFLTFVRERKKRNIFCNCMVIEDLMHSYVNYEFT